MNDKKIIYLTFGDGYSGIYESQVIDVVNFVNSICPCQIELVSFQSPRIFLSSRNKIMRSCDSAIVIPSYPKLRNWRKNILSLYIFLKKRKIETIVSRGVFATDLALQMKAWGLVEKVVYDGRGAVAAEWEEYGDSLHEPLREIVVNLERNAVLDSDERIAVSHKLVNYWKYKYAYHSDKHYVIPCLLSKPFLIEAKKARLDRIKIRESLGFERDSIIVAFSGGIGEWQSFNMLFDVIIGLLQSDSRVNILLLTRESEHALKLKKIYGERIKAAWVDPLLVPRYLAVADYGLMIREGSVTNKVSAPTKFAEYLALGLKVIISRDIGDYTDFVLNHRCGFVWDSGNPKLERTSEEEVVRIAQIAEKHFTKERYSAYYKSIFCRG